MTIPSFAAKIMIPEPSSTATLRFRLEKWFVVTLLAGAAVFLLVEVMGGGEAAHAQAGSAQSAGVLAVAGRISADTYGLYLIDREKGIIVVYQWLPGKPGKLKLAAARNCTFDLQLDDYNTEPSPREIQSLVLEGKGLSSLSP